MWWLFVNCVIIIYKGKPFGCIDHRISQLKPIPAVRKWRSREKLYSVSRKHDSIYMLLNRLVRRPVGWSVRHNFDTFSKVWKFLDELPPRLSPFVVLVENCSADFSRILFVVVIVVVVVVVVVVLLLLLLLLLFLLFSFWSRQKAFYHLSSAIYSFFCEIS